MTSQNTPSLSYKKGKKNSITPSLKIRKDKKDSISQKFETGTNPLKLTEIKNQC